MAGLDTNNGLSHQSPWKTVAYVARTQFAPGSRILFRCGQEFSSRQALILFSNGTADAPIIIDAYGSGAAPRLINTDTAQYANGINIYGSYVILRNLAVVGAKPYGVFIGGADVALRHLEVTNSVLVSGSPRVASAFRTIEFMI